MDYSFYNTINLTGEMLLMANAKVQAQGDLIKNIFDKNPTKQISPSQILFTVQKKYNLHWPITSIRRAMTDLTKMDVLVKTSVKVMGMYGMHEHCWGLKNEYNQAMIEKMPSGETLAKIAGKMTAQGSLFDGSEEKK